MNTTQVRITRRELFEDVLTRDGGRTYSIGKVRRVRWMIENLNGFLVHETRDREFTTKRDGVAYAQEHGYEVVR